MFQEVSTNLEHENISALIFHTRIGSWGTLAVGSDPPGCANTTSLGHPSSTGPYTHPPALSFRLGTHYPCIPQEKWDGIGSAKQLLLLL